MLLPPEDSSSDAEEIGAEDPGDAGAFDTPPSGTPHSSTGGLTSVEAQQPAADSGASVDMPALTRSEASVGTAIPAEDAGVADFRASAEQLKAQQPASVLD